MQELTTGHRLKSFIWILTDFWINRQTNKAEGDEIVWMDQEQ